MSNFEFYKIKKYIHKPDLILKIIFLKVLRYLKRSIFYFTTFIKRVNFELGKNVIFHQKTIISGNGFTFIGDNCEFGSPLGGYYKKGVCEIQPRYEQSRIKIGNNVSINNNLFICCASEVIIGDNSLIGEGVMIIDHDAHGILPDQRRKSIGKVSDIAIGENVWIGSKVIILPGTRIGNNSIVGAGSVIKGIFPADVIIAGNPGKIIKNSLITN